MVYELKDGTERLTVEIGARAENGELLEGDAQSESKGFRVDLSAGPKGEVLVTEHGTTRTAALEAAGITWRTIADERGLPPFDFAAVVLALRSVRAIE